MHPIQLITLQDKCHSHIFPVMMIMMIEFLAEFSECIFNKSSFPRQDGGDIQNTEHSPLYARLFVRHDPVPVHRVQIGG